MRKIQWVNDDGMLCTREITEAEAEDYQRRALHDLVKRKHEHFVDRLKTELKILEEKNLSPYLDILTVDYIGILREEKCNGRDS